MLYTRTYTCVHVCVLCAIYAFLFIIFYYLPTSSICQAFLSVFSETLSSMGSRLGIWGSDLLLLFDRSPSLRYVGYVAGLLHIPWNILNIYWMLVYISYIFKMPLHYMHIYIICTRYFKYFAIILSILYFCTYFTYKHMWHVYFSMYIPIANDTTTFYTLYSVPK